MSTEKCMGFVHNVLTVGFPDILPEMSIQRLLETTCFIFYHLRLVTKWENWRQY